MKTIETLSNPEVALHQLSRNIILEDLTLIFEGFKHCFYNSCLTTWYKFVCALLH